MGEINEAAAIWATKGGSHVEIYSQGHPDNGEASCASQTHADAASGGEDWSRRSIAGRPDEGDGSGAKGTKALWGSAASSLTNEGQAPV